jgi:5-methylcytosine-specific restriction endonuclease McrA
MEVISRKEAISKGLKRYFTGKQCVNSHVAERYTSRQQCVQCSKDTNVEFRITNREYVKNYLKEYGKTYNIINKEHRQKLNKSYEIKNKDARYRQHIVWYAKNPHKRKFYGSKRRAAKLSATPLWVDLGQIETIYGNCPKDKAVDHIISLQGNNVSGLHVPWNLQYLTQSENSSKGNKLLPEYATGVVI